MQGLELFENPSAGPTESATFNQVGKGKQRTAPYGRS
jgi:hypothetical protein